MELYEKQDWTDGTVEEPEKGTPINSEKMSHIEDGIYNLSVAINSISDEKLIILDGTPEGYKEAMRKWFIGHEGFNVLSPVGLTELCDEWYERTRDSWCGYTEFDQPDVSTATSGTKGGDNTGLSCTPSTDETANQDDYAGLPLFACVDVNWEIDPDTLEPVITAIDGINSGFKRKDPNKLVGVMQMSGYYFEKENEKTYIRGYAANRNIQYSNVYAMAEAVRVDNTVREWFVHAKYMSHTVDGKMTSCSGYIPTTFLSHNTLHTLSKANGDQYSGTTTADISFLQIMAMIKYGVLGLDGVLQGCCNMNYQYAAQVSESGVRRIILSASNGANIEVGMSCLLGNYAGNADRGQSAMYSITGQAGAIVTKVENITIDGTDYTAVYVNTDETFDTVANGSSVEGTTYFSSFLWSTGKTDGVLGNDGSPVSNTSGKYPAKLQGIEYMNGGYEIVADVILNEYLEGDDDYYFEPIIAIRSSDQSTSITANYKDTGLICKNVVALDGSASWQYIKKLSYAKGVMFPTELGGSSSTYVKDGFYQPIPAVVTREWLARGTLNSGVAGAGLFALYGNYALSHSGWACGARLSAAGNRGEWTA